MTIVKFPSQPPTLPFDEWIVGKGSGQQQISYVVHASAPRFIVRVVRVDERSNPVDGEILQSLGGDTLRALNLFLCEMAWIDTRPSRSETVVLLEAAAAEYRRQMDRHPLE